MSDLDALIDQAPEAPQENVSRETSTPEPVEPESVELTDAQEDSSSEPNESDEYGNEVPKEEKTYTQAQVEAMIRDRISRVKQPQNEQPQQNQETPKDFKYDEDSNKSWEQQLENFMDGWASKREQKKQEQEWQKAEQTKQTEFEGKFNSGMAKYRDFNDVVANQPIDDHMLMATRGMKDPAAFLYAAAKKQPAELQRIAQIADPYAKMMEVGRLDERMKKHRESTSKAPKPATQTKGDSIGRAEPRSLDDKIRQYAEKNLRGR